jgi:hypothetical protein
MHCVPQAPQWFGSVDRFTQAPPQDTCPAGQVHAPPLQICPRAHATPHPPQWSTSVCTLTHAPPQLVNPAPHWSEHCPCEHTSDGGQTMPQPPQSFGFEERSTHCSAQTAGF